jgi:hypothetical protein
MRTLKSPRKQEYTQTRDPTRPRALPQSGICSWHCRREAARTPPSWGRAAAPQAALLATLPGGDEYFALKEVSRRTMSGFNRQRSLADAAGRSPDSMIVTPVACTAAHCYCYCCSISRASFSFSVSSFFSCKGRVA